MRIFHPRGEIVIGEGILPKQHYFRATFLLDGTPDDIFIAIQSLELLIGLKSGIQDVPGVKNGFTPRVKE